MTPDQRARLRTHLIESRLSGETKTPREGVVRNARALAAGDPDKALGLEHGGLDLDEVMEAVAELCGCSTDQDDTHGPGVIDPDRTLDGVSACAARLRRAVAEQERLLICTGHPTGLLPMYMSIARALGEMGSELLRPLDGEKLGGGLSSVLKRRGNRVRFLDGVGVYADGASLYHTHDGVPMERLLEAGRRPDLVLADHGFAGAAVARGIETIAFTDVNDPSIAVAKARRMIEIVIPLDANLSPATVYDPLRDYIVEEIRTGSSS